MEPDRGPQAARIRGAHRRVRRFGLGTVLVALALNLLLGLWLKSQPTIEDGRLRTPCAEGDWGEEHRQYTRLCYSDIVPLYGTEQLQDSRLPFLQPCTPVEGLNCDEYPVLTMYTMWLASLGASGTGSFFFSNAFLLAFCAVVTATCLYVMAGSRALWFALAPTLLAYGFMNWDLVAVALATGGTLAFLRGRDVLSGVLLGLGTAAKLYPALFVIPFVVHRVRQRDPDGGIHLAWAAAGTWLAVNLPFLLFGFEGWSQFFRFNANRILDHDSLWKIACRHLTGGGQCVSPRAVNVLSLVALGAGVALVWWLRARRDPDFPRWTLGLPTLIVFLLMNKVYSPQFSLWLLPWMVLALPGLGRFPAVGLFGAFQLAEIAVFVTRFTWFNLFQFGGGGPPEWAFETAVLVRDAVLVLCLVAWTTQPSPKLPLDPLRPPEEEPEGEAEQAASGVPRRGEEPSRTG